MITTIRYRKLDTSGDTLSWVAIERTLYTDWDEFIGPTIGCWNGIVALAPIDVSGGGYT